MTTPPSSMSLRSNLDALFAEAIKRGIASSLSVAIVCPPEPGLVIHKGLVGASHKTNDETLYDLASLTKILGTTMAVAKAVADGVMHLDETPWKTWPHISIRHVVTHTAGLLAHKKFAHALALSDEDFLANKHAIEHELMSMPTHAGAERLYSDMGFIALGLLLEERYQKPLMAIFCEAWRACGLVHDFCFFKSCPVSHEVIIPHAAPTYCYDRNQRRQGQVHDANCHYLGGLAGHAGLFGTLAAVSCFGEVLLTCLHKPATTYQKTLAEFARLGLGFDKPSPDGSNACLSPHAVGHFGYTGVSLFVDPDLGPRGCVIALLTNRINESDKPEGIFWLRKAVNEAVASALRLRGTGMN